MSGRKSTGNYCRTIALLLLLMSAPHLYNSPKADSKSQSLPGKLWPCSTEYPDHQAGCEGEGCGLLMYSKLLEDVRLLVNPFKPDKGFNWAKRCEIIQKFEPYFTVDEPGIVEVLATNEKATGLGIKIGDKLVMKKYIGEGFMEVCAGDTFLEAVLDEKPHHNQLGVKWIRYSVTRQYIYIETDSARGYAIDRPGFYLGYGSYPNDELLCPGDSQNDLRKSYH